MNPEIQRRAQRIRLLALDVDGVLTDGGVYVLEDGTEFRRFDIKDGLGLKRVMEAGIEVAIISVSDSQAVVHRAKRLGIVHVYTGCYDKLEQLMRLCQTLGISLSEVAYMGDDLTDLPVLERVGLALAPADAVREVRQVAHIITTSRGGYGAVREVCEMVVLSRLESRLASREDLT